MLGPSPWTPLCGLIAGFDGATKTQPRAMVSYAKWDKFVSELEDEDEDEDEEERVKVTTLEGGSSVRLGPDGAEILPTATATASSGSAKAASTQSTWSTKNGGRTEEHAWRQGRDEVVVELFLQSTSTRAKDVVISYDAMERLFVVKAHGAPVLSKKLMYDIEPNPGAGSEGESVVDWEIKSRGGAERFIEFTLRKKSPFAGVCIWWKCVFVGDPEIDVTTIEGRDSASAQSNRIAWEEAHKMFIEKVQTRERVELDIEDD